MASRAPALIVGDDPVNGLGVARNLGRAGVPVHRLGAARDRLLRSRYIVRHHVLPDLEGLDDEGYLRVLGEVSRKIGGPSVLFPITDLHVLRLSRLAPRLPAGFLTTTPGFQAVETLVNKRLFYRALEARGVEHPATRFPESPAEFERAAEEIGYPVYLKPEISPLFSRAFQRKGFVARDRNELRDHVNRVIDSGLTVMLQEIVPGDATCMHGCAGYRRGGEAVWICYRRVREFPAGFGCGSVLESCRDFLPETRLLEFLDALDYRGIFDAEFKLDPRRGGFRLIEINARSWWQNLLPTRCGINVIELAYLDATGKGGARLPAQQYAQGVKWIHLYNDFFAARERGMGTREWIRSLGGRRVFAFCAADDPLPATLQLAALTLGKLGKLFRG